MPLGAFGEFRLSERQPTFTATCQDNDSSLLHCEYIHTAIIDYTTKLLFFFFICCSRKANKISKQTGIRRGNLFIYFGSEGPGLSLNNERARLGFRPPLFFVCLFVSMRLLNEELLPHRLTSSRRCYLICISDGKLTRRLVGPHSEPREISSSTQRPWLGSIYLAAPLGLPSDSPRHNLLSSSLSHPPSSLNNHISRAFLTPRVRP